jgi:hypothetical protein
MEEEEEGEEEEEARTRRGERVDEAAAAAAAAARRCRRRRVESIGGGAGWGRGRWEKTTGAEAAGYMWTAPPATPCIRSAARSATVSTVTPPFCIMFVLD